jgi:hypothetical protein
MTLLKTLFCKTRYSAGTLFCKLVLAITLSSVVVRVMLLRVFHHSVWSLESLFLYFLVVYMIDVFRQLDADAGHD